VTARVRLLDEAVAELEDASSWYDQQRLGLGLVFLAAVDRTIDRVSRWPFTGSLVDGVDEVLEVRRLPVEAFPYYLAYISGEQGLTVLAVAHERRRPRYWSNRAD
jgi:toxin ParE1/3/4